MPVNNNAPDWCTIVPAYDWHIRIAPHLLHALDRHSLRMAQGISEAFGTAASLRVNAVNSGYWIGHCRSGLIRLFRFQPSSPSALGVARSKAIWLVSYPRPGLDDGC